MRFEEWIHLRGLLKSSADVSAYASKQSRYSYETLNAMFQQLTCRHIIKFSHLTKQRGDQFVKRYNAGVSLLDIAEWVNLPPTVVARRVVELVCSCNRKTLTAMLKDPTKIENDRLAAEVKLCVDADEYAGPHVDRVRNVYGLEYEFRLIGELRNLRLEFESERDLRKRGCRKTPDVLLRVPVAFYERVICWVDSKAKFGDEYSMNKDYQDSISSYIGRFGPGLVIYWFGFIEDCPSPMFQDRGVLIVDHFPQQIDMLPGTILPHSSGLLHLEDGCMGEGIERNNEAPFHNE